MLFTHPFTAIVLAAGLIDTHGSEVLVIVLLVCTCSGLFSAMLADGVGRNGWAWFLIGCLPVIGWIAPGMCLARLPPRTRLPFGSAVPRQRVAMAGLRGFVGGMLAVMATYAALVLVLCPVDLELAHELISVAALVRLAEGIGVVGLCFALSRIQRASKGLDPSVTDLGPRKEIHAGSPG